MGKATTKAGESSGILASFLAEIFKGSKMIRIYQKENHETKRANSFINKEGKNIHEYSFVEVPKNWENQELCEKWDKLLKIKQEANVAIEAKRSTKEIGSSLEAAIKLFLDKNKFKSKENLDWAEYLITSKADKILSKENEIRSKLPKQKETNVQDAGKI